MPLARRILFYSFVVLFFLAGFALLFMAQGYRYSAQKGVIERTGEVSVDTKPKGARVTVDNVLPLSFLDRLEGKKEMVTPARIKAVLSGQHRVSLEKDGFFPWTQMVTVLPGRAAVLSGIMLLSRPTAPIIPASSNITHIVPVDGNRFVYRTKDDRIGFLDSRTKIAEPAFDPQERVTGLHVSLSGKQVLIVGVKHLWLLRSDGRVLAASIIRGSQRSFAWSRADDLYALGDDGISLFSPKKKVFVNVLQGLYTQVVVDDMLTTVDRSRMLRTYRIEKSEHPSLVTARSVPSGTIISQENGFFVLSDTARNELLLIDKKNPALPSRHVPHAHSLRWLNSTAAITWDDFEISNVSLAGGARTTVSLITRQSDPIGDVIATQGIPYIFILTKKGGLDARDATGSDPNNSYRFFDDSARITSAITQGKVMVTAGEFKGVSGITIVPLQE